MKYLLYLIVFLSFNFSFAQKKSKGDVAFKSGHYDVAIDHYVKEYGSAKGVEKKGYIQYRLGQSYNATTNYEKAIKAYERSYNLGYQKYDQELLMKYAQLQLNQGDFRGAQDNFEEYLKSDPSNVIAKNGLESCKKAKGWLAEPTRYKVRNISELNTENYDWSMAQYDKKGQQYLFSSSRQGALGSSMDPIIGENYTDLFISRQDKNGKWGEPTPLPQGINTPANEGAAVMNAKGTKMYFTRCGYTKKQSRGCDIFYAEKQGQNWKEPILIPLKDSAVFSVGHPAVARNEKYMIFASDMAGGKGGKDLWITLYDKRAGSWTKPKNLGSQINTAGNEMFPYLSNDGKLFFASDGLAGLGGLDVFEAESIGDKQWGKIKNLGSPINSHKDDYAFSFAKSNTRKGFLTSNRDNGKGKDDLYAWVLPEDEITITVKVYSHCDVKDPEDKGEPLKGAKITLTGSDGSSVEVTTNDEGMFTFAKRGTGRYVKKDVNYTIVVEADKHLIGKDKRSTMGISGDKNLYTDLHLQRTDCGEIVMPEVQYVFNDSTFINDSTISSNDSMMFLYNVLIENPTIVVELQAHTDCRGGDAYNLSLSQGRANECVEFLISKGIPAARLVAKGYGETQPRTLKNGTKLTCDFVMAFENTDKAKFKRYHQLNRRTTFSVLSFDYKPQ